MSTSTAGPTPDSKPGTETPPMPYKERLDAIDLSSRSYDYQPKEGEEMTPIGELPELVLRIYALHAMVKEEPALIHKTIKDREDVWRHIAMSETTLSLRRFILRQIEMIAQYDKVSNEVRELVNMFAYWTSKLTDLVIDRDIQVEVIGQTLYAVTPYCETASEEDEITTEDFVRFTLQSLKDLGLDQKLPETGE